MNDSERDQPKSVKDWNSYGNVGDGPICVKLLPLLQLGGRQRNGKNGQIFSRCVDFTCLNCFSQTHLATAVRHISIQLSILRKS